MKIETIERGGRYFLRKYWLGFIPVYWDDGYDGGWWFFRYPVVSKERAIQLIGVWKARAAQKSRYKNSKEFVFSVVELNK